MVTETQPREGETEIKEDMDSPGLLQVPEPRKDEQSSTK